MNATKKITIEKSWLANQEQFAIRFYYDIELIQLIRKVQGAHWKADGKCWIVPGTAAHLQMLKEIFSAYDLQEIEVDRKDDRRSEKAIELEMHQDKYLDLTKAFSNWLQLRSYGLNTIETYCGIVDWFFRKQHPLTPGDVSNEILNTFMFDHIVQRGLSVSYQRQFINAMKLFFNSIQNSKINIELLVRPKKERQLPKVISQQEVEQIIKSTKNQKHKMALVILYACGLRRSEVLNLEMKDIDSKRQVLIIRQAKGKKDRLVPLPQKLIEQLRTYYMAYRPQRFLFEGQSGAGTKWSAKSLEMVLRKSVLAAGIRKPVNLHMLRHSYATHQLEAGVNLRYIQELLGHKSPTTTQIYTHVTEDSVRKIVSPAERMDIW